MNPSNLKGKGVVVSKQNRYAKIPHFYVQPNGQYSLRKFSKKPLDYIIDDGLISNKFYPVLLQEWFYSLKEGGVLYINTKKSPNNFANKFPFIKDKFNIEKSERYLKLTKIKKTLNKNDSISKWTFGIVTNYSRPDWLEQCITSIYNQKIPNFEIIICGTYNGKIREHMKYIKFIENDHLGWITRKKNIICEHAKYENIVILHDRILLEKDWYKGMIKYGNYFDVLSCRICNKTNERDVDWTTWGGPIFLKHKNGLLDYKDWNRYIYVDGAFYILKKRVWSQNKWNEKYFWNQGEDIELSHRWMKNGVMIRFNPYSQCLTLSDKRSGKLPLYKYSANEEKLEYTKPRHYTIKCFNRDLISIIRFILMKSGILNKVKKMYSIQNK